MKLEVGDIVTTKKPHPCKSNQFEIVRKGADFKMRCLGCNKEIWITREKLEKRVRKVNNELPE
jgi:hypothetical protein